MKTHRKPAQATCPVTVETLAAEARHRFEKLLSFCQQSDLSFWKFEKCLAALLAVLGRVLLRLFLAARHERLDRERYLAEGPYRLGNPYAERTVNTAYGTVRYGRAQLNKRGRGGHGFYPLDTLLGLTRDRLSPWMMHLVGRLATRMSFGEARLVCQALLGWSPATETIEQVVLGLGRQAAPFMKQLAGPAQEGEVLIIEEDGKCPPTATEEELAKRRGRRRRPRDCACGCQRHRGQSKRQARGSKKRRKKGDKSKNGKEAIVVVMYTLKRGVEGRLHGPRNKKIWGSFKGRKAAALWARAEATKRGFGPDTTKTVQIVLDGAKGLKQNLEPLFPQAIFTLDVCHVIEKLWSLGHCFHPEGSPELTAWVEELKTLVYQGQVSELVQQLQECLGRVPRHGPGTKGRREGLRKLLAYLEPRLSMMRYGEWIEKDLVIASGQAEGAVRHLVGERFDCSGMRWIQGKAEPLLNLRCLELNGDWDKFFTWAHERHHDQLRQRQRVKILTDQPMDLNQAA